MPSDALQLNASSAVLAWNLSMRICVGVRACVCVSCACVWACACVCVLGGGGITLIPRLQ